MFKLNEVLKAVKGSLVSAATDAELKGVTIDSRAVKQGDIFIAIKGRNFDGHDFIDEAVKAGAGCVIQEKQKGIIAGRHRSAVIEVGDTVIALGDLARMHRARFNIPVIAVTGSAGKTTVKEMIAWILSKEFNVLKSEGTKNNHIGLPLALLDLTHQHDLAVLELGTNHFGEIEYLAKICQPNIGIITNIGPAHLEYFGALNGVLKEKYALAENLKKPYITLLNADDNLLRQKIFNKSLNPLILSFGTRYKGDFWASDIKFSSRGFKFSINNPEAMANPGLKTKSAEQKKVSFFLNTLGRHNVNNALAAVAAARLFGMEYGDISRRLSRFVFPANRLSLLELNNIRFVDDTYNSNPLSLFQALDTLDNLSIKGRKILVMGDMLELGDFNELFHSQAGHDVAKICDVFVAVGESSRRAASAAGFSGLESSNIFTCSCSSEARQLLFERLSLTQDDIVLVKGSRNMRMEEILKVPD